MEFFLYQIVARAVAIYLCVDTAREVWIGLAERKIAPYCPGFLDRLDPWGNWIAHRDASPVTYWAYVSVHAGIFLACLVVAIFGWLPAL